MAPGRHTIFSPKKDAVGSMFLSSAALTCLQAQAGKQAGGTRGRAVSAAGFSSREQSVQGGHRGNAPAQRVKAGVVHDEVSAHAAGEELSLN